MEGGDGAQSKERKGSNFAAQRSGAIVQKPEGPNTYDLKSDYRHLATTRWFKPPVDIKTTVPF